MKRTRRILVVRPGSRVDVYGTECVREMMKVKREEMNREANKIGRRVHDVIADGDVLDHSPESLERSIVSGPRVINTLSSRTEGQWAGPDGISRSMFMYYLEPNRAGSHGTSGVGVIIVLGVCYVLLITCWSAGGDAEGAPRAERCHPHYVGGY
jgi:hypothetical protein